MSARLHTHAFKGVTVFVDGHLHLYHGISSASPDIPGHTHIIAGQTTVNDGHSHGYNIVTEGPHKVNSGHYHYFNGNTQVTMGHSHGMSSTTFEYP